jgi:biopolymer transport protein TolR
MGMTAASPRGRVLSAINVTPMIDVLLVLLIIFMVVQQGLQRGLSLQVPPPTPAVAIPEPPASLVLEVLPGGAFRLNAQPVVPGQLAGMLRGVFAHRPRKLLFVKGAEGVPYADVVAAVDASRTAGVEVVSLVPRTAAH